MTTRYLVEGETKPITATLFDGDGASRAAANLTGLSLGIVVYDRTGASVAVTGKATVTDAANGRVQFAPDADDFKAANNPYAVTWTVTDGTGDIACYPNKESEKWIVRR